MYHDYNMEKILEHIRTCPKKKFILDTDTYNEIDDQFAITYAMLADDIDLLALTAAPFSGAAAKVMVSLSSDRVYSVGSIRVVFT